MPLVNLVHDYKTTTWADRDRADAGDIVVVGEAGDGDEGIEQATALTANVVLMDLRMPGRDGVAATAALRERVPDARVLILTTFDSESDVLPAIEAGAIGYLLKDALPDELMRAVRAAARGDSVLAPSTARVTPRCSPPHGRTDRREQHREREGRRRSPGRARDK